MSELYDIIEQLELAIEHFQNKHDSIIKHKESDVEWYKVQDNYKDQKILQLMKENMKLRELVYSSNAKLTELISKSELD